MAILIEVMVRKTVTIVTCHLIVFRRTDECYKLWLFKVNRSSVTDSARICSEHFISGMYENLTLIVTAVYSSRHRSSFCSKLFFCSGLSFLTHRTDIGNKSSRGSLMMNKLYSWCILYGVVRLSSVYKGIPGL